MGVVTQDYLGLKHKDAAAGIWACINGLILQRLLDGQTAGSAARPRIAVPNFRAAPCDDSCTNFADVRRVRCNDLLASITSLPTQGVIPRYVILRGGRGEVYPPMVRGGLEYTPVRRY